MTYITEAFWGGLYVYYWSGSIINLYLLFGSWVIYGYIWVPSIYFLIVGLLYSYLWITEFILGSIVVWSQISTSNLSAATFFGSSILIFSTKTAPVFCYYFYLLALKANSTPTTTTALAY